MRQGTIWIGFIALASTACAIIASGAQAAETLTPRTATVTTGAASAVTGKTAVLGGTITTNGLGTTYSFQYGATTSYGAQTRTKIVRASDTTRPVAAVLVGLTPGTVYHFRLVSTNPAGTVDGADETFTTTLAPAPTAVTGTATVRAKAATLSGTVTPNDAPTTYFFQYGTTTSYGAQTSTRYAGAGSSGVAVFAFIPGLTPGGAYHFRLVAASNSGTSDGSDQAFTTALPALQPTVVTGSPSAVTRKAAVVGGTVTPNGAPTTYLFQFGATTSYGSQTQSLRAGSGGSAVSVVARLDGLSPGKLYHYRLVATNAAGTTNGSDQSLTTTAAAAVTSLSGKRHHR
jgi:hypothetical protein